MSSERGSEVRVQGSGSRRQGLGAVAAPQGRRGRAWEGRRTVARAIRSCLVVSLLALAFGCQRQSPPAKLLLYCGAGLRPPVAEIAIEFGRQHGVLVECDYAGSEVLLGRAKLSGQGDLYLPGDLHYVELARQEGLLTTSKTACYLVPVILVQKGNPKGIQGLADLWRPGIKLGLGDPEACAIGRQSRLILAKNQIPEEKIRPSVVMHALTVNELGNSVKLKALDATIVWDAVAASYTGTTEVVPIPPEQNVASTVPVGILKCCRQPELAAKFLDFIGSPQAVAIFEKHHYTTRAPQ